MTDVNTALTAAGQVLRAKIELGDGTVPLEITRIVTAAGRSDDPLNLTAGIDEKLEFKITGRVTAGTRTVIRCLLTNYGNPETGEPPLAVGYPLSQVLFYAIDPDEGEILYRISQYGSPYYVPAVHERGWTFEPTFNFVTDNAREVIVRIDPSGFATLNNVWGSVEYSDNAEPAAGVKTHYRETEDASEYTPSVPTALYEGAKITEIIVRDSPGDPAENNARIALPVTVLEAVLKQETGETLAKLLEGHESGQTIKPNLTDGDAASTLPTEGTPTALTALLNTVRNCLKWLVGRFDASGNPTGKAATAGTADTANALTTARTITVSPTETAAGSFDGSANTTVGVSVTTAAGTAANTLPATGATALQTWLVTARNCLAWLVGRFDASGNPTGKAATAGTADTANALTTARTITVSPTATTAASFNGSQNVTAGVSVTTAAGTAANTLPATGATALQTWLVTCRNCLAWLVGRFDASGNPTGKAATAGTADTANALTTARTITVSPTATTAASFNGSQNVTAGVSVTTAAGTAANTLPATGATALQTWLVTCRNCLAWLVGRFNASGVLTVANGGTAATTAAAARTSLGAPASPASVSNNAVGTWGTANASTGQGYTLPAGGTWAFWGIRAYTSGGNVNAVSATHAATAAGGTLVMGGETNVNFAVLIWRIA